MSTLSVLKNIQRDIVMQISLLVCNIYIYKIQILWKVSLTKEHIQYACDPSNRSSQKKKGHSWENMHFSTKPRHMTPQIDHLGERSTVLRVSTHIFGVSMEIDGKMFIFGVNLVMWPLKSIILEKQALFWGFQLTFMGFQGDRWENTHF